MAASLTISINGGALQTGGVSANLNDTARLRSGNADGSVYRFEVYGFPPGASLSGWTYDTGNKLWFALGATPTDITLTPWGDWLLRLIVDDGSEVDDTDSSGCIRVVSPILGLCDQCPGYFDQMGTDWSEDYRANLRIIETVLGGLIP